MVRVEIRMNGTGTTFELILSRPRHHTENIQGEGGPLRYRLRLMLLMMLKCALMLFLCVMVLLCLLLRRRRLFRLFMRIVFCLMELLFFWLYVNLVRMHVVIRRLLRFRSMGRLSMMLLMYELLLMMRLGNQVLLYRRRGSESEC